MSSCKWCNAVLTELTGHQRSNHMRWCVQNPKRTSYNEKLALVRAAKKKKGSNQWTNFDWTIVSFEELPKHRRRKRVLEEAKFACEICGFHKTRTDGKNVIQVDHIDGNDKNWSRTNLRALCPNCHAVHSEHFMFYGRKHTGDMSRFNTSKSRHGVTDNMQTSEV